MIESKGGSLDFGQRKSLPGILLATYRAGTIVSGELRQDIWMGLTGLFLWMWKKKNLPSALMNFWFAIVGGTSCIKSCETPAVRVVLVRGFLADDEL